MDRRLAVSLVLTVVVLSVSLAWLLGGGGGAGGTGGAPEAGETTPVGTSTDDSEENLTGFDRAAIARHERILGQRDYALVSRVDRPDGPPVVRTVRSSLRAERMNLTVRRANESLAEYLVDGDLYRQRTENGTVEYERVRNVTAQTRFERLHTTGVGRGTLRTLVAVGNYTAAGNVTRDGRRLRRYTVTDLSQNAQPAGTLVRVSGAAYVDRRGVVWSANISLSVRQNGTVRTSTTSYRVTAVGNVSVTAPGWLEAAREATR